MIEYKIGQDWFTSEDLDKPITTADDRVRWAAPDLLVALRGILDIGKRDLTNPKYDGYFESARRAVQKATGGQ